MTEIKESHTQYLVSQTLKNLSVPSVRVVLHIRYDKFFAIIEFIFYAEERQELKIKLSF